VIESPYGMILVTGADGRGQATTLYTGSSGDTADRNIITSRTRSRSACPHAPGAGQRRDRHDPSPGPALHPASGPTWCSWPRSATRRRPHQRAGRATGQLVLSSCTPRRRRPPSRDCAISASAVRGERGAVLRAGPAPGQAGVPGLRHSRASPSRRCWKSSRSPRGQALRARGVLKCGARVPRTRGVYES